MDNNGTFRSPRAEVSMARAKIGIYNLHMQSRGGGENLTLALAEHLSSRHRVVLFHSGALDQTSLESAFGVDLSRVTFRRLNQPALPMKVMAKLRGGRAPAFSLHHYLELRKLKLDLFINSSYANGLACPSARGIFVCMFPHRLRPNPSAGVFSTARNSLADRAEQLFTGCDVKEVVGSYSAVVAISDYSAKWTRQLWGRDAHIIYPRCEDMGPPGPKQKILLHVGRFSSPNAEWERHHKAQDVLLDVFKQLADLHRLGWELHFVGAMGTDKESADFVKVLINNAGGYPVKFHFDVDRHTLRDLYRKAAIYWHATGYGCTADEYPAKQEHFGISTVEAMSAGVVPVVRGSGGQTEVVTHGVDGFCWHDTSELISQTLLLIRDAELRAKLSSQAVISARRFNREVFASSVDRLVQPLLANADSLSPPVAG